MIAAQPGRHSTDGNSEAAPRGRQEEEEEEEGAFLPGFKGYFYPLPPLLHPN